MSDLAGSPASGSRRRWFGRYRHPECNGAVATSTAAEVSRKIAHSSDSASRSLDRRCRAGSGVAVGISRGSACRTARRVRAGEGAFQGAVQAFTGKPVAGASPGGVGFPAVEQPADAQMSPAIPFTSGAKHVGYPPDGTSMKSPLLRRPTERRGYRQRRAGHPAVCPTTWKLPHQF